MIPQDIAALAPARRAQLIYAQAQSELSTRLWRAALGDTEQRDAPAQGAPPAQMTMDTLLAMLRGESTTGSPKAKDCCHCCEDDDVSTPSVLTATQTAAQPSSPEQPSVPPAAARTADAQPARSVSAAGVNAPYRAAFAAAEARTGVPAAALVAIVDAEAAKRPDGSWNPHSRNPRSSAAGLGQFLSGTWRDLAETPGTALNDAARQRGWLNARGQVIPSAQADLLAMRYDADTSIAAVADLARNNLNRLERDGFAVRESSETLAKAAYLGHHLGLGDARRFLGSGIDSQRARVLLAAQIGPAAAADRIDRAGGATQAHRQWLLGYIRQRIRPDQFAA